MPQRKLIAIVCLIAGVLLIAWAYQSSSSVTSELSRSLGGSMAIEHIAGYVGGIVLLFLGIKGVK